MKTCGRLGLGAGALLSLGLVVGTAHAQEPSAVAPAAAPSEPAAAADPDVVRLKNGGLVRGKISELIPGDSVTIVTVTGKTREFPMSEVSYAGPAGNDPEANAAPPPHAESPKRAEAPARKQAEDFDAGERNDDNRARPYVTVHGREARLHLVADEDDITFYRQTGSAIAVGPDGSAFATGYERMCTAPCDVSLPAGTETIALSRQGKQPKATKPISLPPGRSELRGSFVPRSGAHTAGWLVLVGGTIVGAALLYTAPYKTQDCTGFCKETLDVHIPNLVGGLVLLTGGLGVGIPLACMPDKAVVEVASSNGAVSRPLAVARGVTLSGRF